jgi:hypothetical protein
MTRCGNGSDADRAELAVGNVFLTASGSVSGFGADGGWTTGVFVYALSDAGGAAVG